MNKGYGINISFERFEAAYDKFERAMKKLITKYSLDYGDEVAIRLLIGFIHYFERRCLNEEGRRMYEELKEKMDEVSLEGERNVN